MEEKKLVSANEGFSFVDFVAVVTGKWMVFQDSLFNCTCSVGQEYGICLDSEEDFANLLILCEHTQCKVVSVVVTPRINVDCVSVSVSDGENSEDCIRVASLVDCLGADNVDGVCGSGVKFPEKFIQKGWGKASVNVDDFPEELTNCSGRCVDGGLSPKNCTQNNGCKSSDKLDDCAVGNGCAAGKPPSMNNLHKRKADCLQDGGFKGVQSRIPTFSFGCQKPDFGGIVADIPSYDVCPTLKKAALLSNNWCNIMEGGVGVEFSGGASEFRRELSKYSTKIGFRYAYLRNDSRYIHAVCKEEARGRCEWYIKGKRMNITNYFTVYKANMTHSCVGKLVNDTSRMGAKLMGSSVLQQVKADPTIGGVEIIHIMKNSYGIDLSYSRAWRTVEAARNMIFGSYQESYDHLKWYCRAILRTNPRSIVCLQQNSSTLCIERVFIAFKASIEGFQSCRPMLFVDGTFMKGRAKGTLLSATAKDGNNGLFPVAIAIVSVENNDNWIWFLEKLRDNIRHDKKIFYISDRNLGLMNAFPKVFAEPVHFYCLVHLQNNLKLRFGTGWTNTTRANLGILFRACAYAPNVRIFKEKLKDFIQVGGIIAEKFISEIDFDKWAAAYSPHITRYGEMTSNAAESFNSWIREARSLPITYMVDSIMKGICRWFVERRREASTWNDALCGSKQDLWNYLSEIGRSWMIHECPNGSYQVASSPTTVVDLSQKVCSCYQWQVQGFPCSHAVAVIRKSSCTVYSYIESCLFAKNYMECYKSHIHSIPETERYECTDPLDPIKILPPMLKRPTGRPKKDRRITSYSLFKQSSKNKQLYCGSCGKYGSHDISSCPETDHHPESRGQQGC